jgi:hypothetical protein
LQILKISKIERSILLVFILLMLIFSLSDSSAQSNIVVNEFESNPPGNDYDAGSEWVELYNPTTDTVDISNWKIIPTNNETNTIILPEGTIIRAKGYYVAYHSTQFLDNAAETIILQDAAGNEIDRTPSVNDTNDDEGAWARYPNGIDTDDDTDWIFQQSTKGVSNDGEETYGQQPESSPAETPSPMPSPKETQPTPTPEQTTPSTTQSLDETPMPARSSQTIDFIPYIPILISILTAIAIAFIYLFKILPSRLRELDR